MTLPRLAATNLHVILGRTLPLFPFVSPVHMAAAKKPRLDADPPAAVGFEVDQARVRLLNGISTIPKDAKSIIYWMSRDQRVKDNWALLYALQLSLARRIPLRVCFCLVPKFLEATERQYGFMLKGLREVERDLASLSIPFHLLTGTAAAVLPAAVATHSAGAIVADFSPLRVPLAWANDVARAIRTIPVYQVDAHNIIPCWRASSKQETAARTFRPRVHEQLSHYLTEFPAVVRHPHGPACKPETDWAAADASLEIDRTIKEVAWAQPGEKAGLEMLDAFVQSRLRHFATDRNDPNKAALSNLSPWLHFGQLSAQRAALTVQALSSKHPDSVKAFIEESVVRRELADNYCYYNAHYDSLAGAAVWARDTLEVHASDPREFTYTLEQLERGQTHDKLWNAAQLQMVREGKMHGFLRMYWAKKILEWSPSAEIALRHAIYLNDRYELDGRDPNGYVGCMWSICCVHDMGWPERPVFGKIRFMNYAGCKRKFDVALFEAKYSGAQQGVLAAAAPAVARARAPAKKK